MRAALAIDVGSSSLRAALLDERGALLGGTLAQTDVELRVGEGGRAQLDASRLREAIENAIDATLRMATAEVEIVVVSMTTFWHSLVVLGTSGEPRTPVLTWADTRAEAEALELRARLDADAVHQRTGCIIHPSYLPAKLLWLRKHQPELFHAGAAFVSFAQYCIGIWLGTRATSVSMASGSGLLNTAACDWDAELLHVLDISPDALGGFTPEPELLPAVSGAYAERWPRLRDVPWRAPIGDGAASNVGAGCVTPQRLAMMVGTSGALRLCERERQDGGVSNGLWRYRLDRTRTLTGGALSDGGSAHAWLRNTLALPSEDEVERELARRAPGEHGLIVLPFWSGERSTGWVGDATAYFAGVKLHTTPLDIYHACIEAITYRFALLFDTLSAVAPGQKTIVATGGGLLASPAWLQLVADVTGNRVVASSVSEASLRGAALIGLRDVGVLGEDALADAPFGAAYEPRPERFEQHRVEIARQELLYAREVGREGVNLLARQTR